VKSASVWFMFSCSFWRSNWEWCNSKKMYACIDENHTAVY